VILEIGGLAVETGSRAQPLLREGCRQVTARPALGAVRLPFAGLVFLIG